MQPADSSPRSATVVGAGPAGLYLSAALVKTGEFAQIDVYEAVPAPYGLVRYGVAPDHPKTRTISRVLARGFESDTVRYFGNVTVGHDVTIGEMRSAYDVVAIASGMLGDRSLGIPGEQLSYSLGASQLVAWYTGHPDAPPVPPLDDVRAAAVIGAGNVALDIARILSRPPETWHGTSMPRHVVAALADSAITDVHLVARRGPAFAKFTSPELHEIGELPGVDVVVNDNDLDLDETDEHEVESRRMAKTTVKLLREWHDRGQTGAPRRIHFHFWQRPTRILGDSRVSAIELAPNRSDHSGITVPVGLVVRAIGYSTTPIGGLPATADSGVVPSENGRITDGGSPVPGLYVTGWLRRGPSGVIGTNRPDANDVAETIVADLPELTRPAGTPDDIGKLLAERNVRVVGWPDWLRLDAHERALGEQHGSDPIVLHDRSTILDVLDASSD